MHIPSALVATSKETELHVTEAQVLTKLIDYQLKPQRVFLKLRVNSAKLNALEEKSNLNNLVVKLKAWQPCNNISTFTQHINQLVSIWLDAMQQGSDRQAIMRLLRCFEIKSLLLGNTAKFHCFILDIFSETSLQQQDLVLNYLLNYDLNTQLPNANQILNSIEKAVSVTHDNQHVGIFSIQLQLSKNNPIFSTSVASSLNKAVAELLQINVTTGDQIFANGNLQFEVLLINSSSEIQFNLLAAKLQRAFEQMLAVQNQSILVTPYIGSAYALTADIQPEDLLANSRLALESALNTEQKLIVYSAALKTQLNTRKALENKILEAFANDGMTLFFQPVVNLKDEKCVGAEALLRIDGPSKLSINPGLMVEILNKTGRGKLFTRWLINSACRYAAELKYQHQLNHYLTINLRAEDLYDFELPHMLLQAAALWKIGPNELVLEVTENGVLELNETTNSVINELAKNGFKLALDDFGTGYSSLSRLRTMPIDMIKIDQTFVRNISSSKDDYEIVKSIAALAKSLGKEVIAEGVEDKKSLDLIKKMKISKCQGYYYAKPMPFDQFVQWAKQH